jgi:2-oxoglutarate ferredoxin oxidoreductase subunit alpha
VEECFHLTRRAFFLAEEFQTPVFVLTDQYLADSFRAVEPFDIGSLDFVRPGSGYAHGGGPTGGAAPPGGEAAAGATAGRSGPESGAYLRHALTENGISPRLIPGMSANLVVTDSDEHTEDGHLTEDLEVRILMVEKRLKKSEGLIKKSVPPEYAGDDAPEILLVSWGSSRGPVMEAARALRERGESTAVLHFSQVWPMAPEAFIKYLDKAGRVVSVEGNATGQLAALIARETGFMIGDRISRYDGRPLTPEYILRKFDSLAGKGSSPGGKE